jgi:hypothetical protein
VQHGLQGNQAGDHDAQDFRHFRNQNLAGDERQEDVYGLEQTGTRNNGFSQDGSYRPTEFASAIFCGGNVCSSSFPHLGNEPHLLERTACRSGSGDCHAQGSMVAADSIAGADPSETLE